MKKIQPHVIILFSAIVIMSFSCKKFLDAKPDQKLAIPQTVEDYQALLDNNDIMNRKSPNTQEFSADDYYYTENDFNTSNEFDRNAYLWGSPAFTDRLPNDWSNCYKPIYFCNLILEGLKKIEVTPVNNADYRNLKGNALFFRARYYFEALNIWAPVYDISTAAGNLGIPLREESDMNLPSVRNSLKTCYEQVLADLQTAAILLPNSPKHVMRASKPAAYGLLSRISLSMRKYGEAKRYADSCLNIKKDLLDYKKLNAGLSFPFERFNQEVLIHFSMTLYNSRMRMDPELYNSYNTNDLRKKLFFKANPDQSYLFKGSYDNSANGFSGIAVDEIFLNRAECNAREGNITQALEDLNTLAAMRYDKGFIPFKAGSSEEALKLILTERRKQLLMRGIRWMDLRRLNMEEKTKFTIKRMLAGKIFELHPNDPRYVLQIPELIIAMTGMPQNPR